MATYEPLLDADLLHTELLKTLDHKCDHVHLKLDTFFADIHAKIDNIEASLAKFAAVGVFMEEFNALKPALTAFVERTTPKSACIFCTLAENLDSHPSGRCPRYPGTYARTFQVSKMGLCGQCLKPEHGEDCKVVCGICRQPHNALLCPAKALHVQKNFKKRKF
ncbi:unnamed protein product [Nippostrongylus brasiliensis]|uniref:Nanos-type domain-containing protein n=1 Tax=Nippostrongylus brasiliensis TaxID=27835 RepID=A0A0N4YEV3_NIPBR|nr:unnamed protein product [Nippostrongylus brasiliensis]